MHETNMTGFRKLLHGLREGITVEPLVLMTMTAVNFLLQGKTQFFYYKLCIIEFNSTSICYNLSAHPDKEALIQTSTSRWMMYSDTVVLVPALFSSLILGAWSDRIGRKPPLIVACIGGVLLGTVWLISAVWIHLPMPLLLLGSACFGITGNYCLILITAVSYITDISCVESRVKRIGIVDGTFFTALVIGVFSSGLLLNAHLYPLIFILFISLYILGELYILICLKETRKPSRKTSTEDVHTHESDPLLDGRETGRPGDLGQASQREEDNAATGTSSGKLFSVDTWVATLIVGVRKRPGRGRSILILIMACFFLNQLSIYGTQNVFLLYAIKPPINWTPTMIGAFIGVIAIANAVSLIVLLPILRWAQLNNKTIVFCTLTLNCIGSALFALVRSTAAIWLAALPLFSFGLISTVYKGITSTLVSPDEKGSAFALLLNMDTAALLFAGLIFDNIYPATLHILNGAVGFLVASGLYVIQFCFFIYTAFLLKYHNT